MTRTVLLTIAAISIGVGVFLIVPLGPGGVGSGGFGSSSAIAGYVLVGIGAAIRMLAPRGSSPFGNAMVITPGRSGQAAVERVVGRRVAPPVGSAPPAAATRARITQVWATGQRARDIVPDLSGAAAEDPVLRVDLVYRSHAGVDVAASAVAIVPADRVGRLVPGSEVPVRYLLDQPQVVALDWG